VDLRSYLAVLAKRWALVTSVLVVSLAASAASILLITPSYRAEARLFVSTQISAGNLNQELFQGSNFSAARVKSYTLLATSPGVLTPVITELGLSVSPKDLAKDISAEVPLETVLITISATSNSPATAAALANRVSANLAGVIEFLETPEGRGSSPVKATVVTEASVPTSPAAPSIPVYLGLGVAIGLVVGLGLALTLETLNTSVKDPADLAAVSSLPVLASVTRDTRRGAPPIVRDDPLGSRSEAYRQLRTNLQFASVDETPRIVVVTSALPGEGKTSVAGNLAVALSQVGIRVCLVDGDLRRPSVATYFGLVAEVGLSTALAGRAGVDEILQPAGTGFSVVTSGLIPPNPAELLSSHRYPALLRELSDRFDMVLVDAPPTLPAADAAVLAAAADGVLFVVHAGRTSRHQVERALQNLDQVKAHMLGVVLNRVPAKGKGTEWYGTTYTYRPDPRRMKREQATPGADVRQKEFVAAGVGGANGVHTDSGLFPKHTPDRDPAGPGGGV
jgi:capsular exopolysaccharide synthesis family protein